MKNNYFIEVICFLVVILLLPGFTEIAEAQTAGDFKGTFIFASFIGNAWQTNFFSLELQSQPPLWHLNLHAPGFHQETFADSNQVEIVTFYDNVKPSSGINTAEIKLFPGSRPLSARFEEHIWAALFSRSFFLGKQAPLNDVGLCIEEPCIFTDFDIENGDSSPRSMKWHNERSDKYSSQHRIEAEFKWLTDTNISSNISVPVRSELSVNVDSQPATISLLTIDSVAPLTVTPPTAPDIRGRAPVYDYRFPPAAGAKLHLTYDTLNGEIPSSSNSPSIKVAMATSRFYRDPAKEKNELERTKSFRYMVMAGLGLISIAFLVFALKQTKTNKVKHV